MWLLQHLHETMIEEYKLDMRHNPNYGRQVLQQTDWFNSVRYWLKTNQSWQIPVESPYDFYTIISLRQMVDMLKCHRLDATSVDEGLDMHCTICSSFQQFPGNLSMMTWRILDAETEGEYGDCFWTFGSLQRAMEHASNHRKPYVTCIVRCWMVGDSLVPNLKAHKEPGVYQKMHIPSQSLVPERMWLIYHRSLVGTCRKGMDYVMNTNFALSSRDLTQQWYIAEALPVRRIFLTVDADSHYGDKNEWVQYSRLSYFLPKVDYRRLGALCRQNITIFKIPVLRAEIDKQYPPQSA